MRLSSFRLALPLAVLAAVLPPARLIAGDAAPAAPAAAPTDSSNQAPATAEATAQDGDAPEITSAPVAETPAKETTPADAAPTPAPAAAPAAAAPAAMPAPAVVDQDTAEAKLAVVLRSYTLLQEENDQLKAAQERNATEKAALEAQFSAAKGAMPMAAQAAALREQLRQTQDQLAALSLENNELKTRLATGAPAPGTANLTPVNVPTLTPVATPAPAPVERFHVVVAGETLGKISQRYYGTPNRWREILAANRNVLKDEKSVFVGAKLRIP